MDKYKIIDGGLSTEITNMGFEIDNDPLWSSRLLQTSPETILAAHENYIRAGSQIITTSSYQASIEGFVKNCGVTVEQAQQLLTSSVLIAQKAKNHQKNGILVEVAGSVGPFGAILANGSEYHGKYVDNYSIEELMDLHRPRMSILVEAECDMLALETIPAMKEGIALVRLLKEFPNTKAWLSFTCKDDHHTAYGDNFNTTVAACLSEGANSDQLLAIGVNCCSPKYISSLAADASLSKNKINPKVQLITYPNSGATWISQVGWKSNDKFQNISSYVPDWIEEGITWFGGCCQTGPKDIMEMTQEIAKYVK